MSSKTEHEIQEISLAQASKTRYFKQLVKINATITGKAVLPYQIPKEITIRCRPTRRCEGCNVRELVGQAQRCTIKFKPTDTNLIKFINISENFFGSVLKSIYNSHSKCTMKYTVDEVYSVEEVYLSEVMTERPMDQVMRVGYAINKTLECNFPYRLECYSVPDPKTQRVAHVIVDADRLKTNIDSYRLTKKDIRELEVFEVGLTKDNDIDTDVRRIYDFLQELYEIYANNLTRIYKRFDLHMAIDLVFHSPLQFYFNNELVHKGYLDVMVIGDTRCGKGYVSENLIKYYGVGEIVSGENVSFAGLVGGVQQLGGRWVITWGKIPLNNKRMVIIDESGEMDTKDFARLSRIRGEGIAEITKIQTERTQAKTRLLFLTNAKNRLISSYTYGIESISDLVDNADDIARFDYVLIVAQSEVDIHEINQHRERTKNPYKDADPKLIQWIWSRTPEQVQIDKDTTDMILRYATKLGEMYSPKIPLIQGENIRIKLAKIAAAIAGRLFSHDKTGEILSVRPVHVQAAYVFLNMVYKKRVSGYYYLSQLHKQSAHIHEQPQFEKYINSFENKYDLVNYFVQNNYITLGDLSECINQPKETAREVISKMIHHKCIQKKYTFYVKNQCFTDWLKENS